MGKKSNGKYIIIPSIMLVLTIVLTFLGDNVGSIIYEVLDEYDITGMTTIFMYLMLVFEVVILVFCIYKGKKGLKDGYDYMFSKFACIIFAVLVIIPIMSFLIVRGEEENQAVELDNKICGLNTEFIDSLQSSIKNNKNNKNSKNKKDLNTQLNEYLDMQKNDKYYDRKREILSEKQNSNIFFEEFVLNPYNYNIFYKKHSTRTPTEDRYYAIYSRISIINAICLGFYIISSAVDEKTNKKRSSRIEKF